MTSEKNGVSNPDAAPAPAPTVGGADPTKLSPYYSLDISYMNSYQTGTYPKTTPDLHFYVIRKNLPPVAANTFSDPTLAFVNIIE